MADTSRYRVTPRRGTVGVSGVLAAYGVMWPAEGMVVSEVPGATMVRRPGAAPQPPPVAVTEVSRSTLHLIESDPRLDVERIDAGPPADPKPPSRGKRSAKS